MSAPRRYRLAIRAYPAAYRMARGPELLATLTEGDQERGRPSLREAAALVHRGLAMRACMLTLPDWLLVAAAVLPLIALVGGFTWSERIFLFEGEAAAILTTGAGWWSFALGLAAYVVLAGRLRDQHERAGRRVNPPRRGNLSSLDHRDLAEIAMDG
jgi:hypothetical protein